MRFDVIQESPFNEVEIWIVFVDEGGPSGLHRHLSSDDQNQNKLNTSLFLTTKIPGGDDEQDLPVAAGGTDLNSTMSVIQLPTIMESSTDGFVTSSSNRRHTNANAGAAATGIPPLLSSQTSVKRI